jgi:hypothetical protein
MRPRVRRDKAVLRMPAGFSRWASVLGSAILFSGTAVSFLPADTVSGLSLSASRRANQVTELYFVNAASADQQQVKGLQTMPMAFGVRDLEGHDMTYMYRITFTDSLGTVVLGEGSVALTDNQSQIVTPYVTVPAGNSRGLVQVALMGRNEVINYWLERTV